MIRFRFQLVCVPALLLFSPVVIFAQASHGAEAAQYADEGQQALAQGRYAVAQVDFEKLAKLHPEVAEVHATLAAIYFEEREYEQAIREVRTAQKLKPGLPRLDSLLALSLAETGRFAQALPGLEKGFRQTADSDVRRMCGLQLLRAYTGVGRDADAVEVALELNKLYPDDPEVLYHTGRIYGNFAYIIMEKLHDKDPNSIWMLQAQGEADESEKDYEAAIAAFNHVLQLDPTRPGIHYRLGRVYLARFEGTHKSEDRDAAIREFNAELAVDPGNGNAGYELADIQAHLGNFNEASEEFKQVLARFPDFEEALVGLAGVDLERQMAQQAVPLLEHATQLRPDDDVAWYRLSQAMHLIGDKEGQAKALAAFKKIYDPAPQRNEESVDKVTPQTLDPGAGSESQ